MDDRKPINRMTIDEMRDELLEQQLAVIARMDETTIKHQLVTTRAQAYLTQLMEEAGMQAPTEAHAHEHEQGSFF